MPTTVLDTIATRKTDSTRGYSGRPITEIITNGFFTVDRNWTVKYWNKAAEKLLKVKGKDIVGKNLWAEFAEILPLDFYAVYHKAFLQDIPVHFEEYWGEMGAWFNVITYHNDNNLSVSFKSSNQLEYADNTGKADFSLQQGSLAELYRLVTEVTNDCLWEWDLNTAEIFWIDGGHKRAFGYPIENAFIPQSFWESKLHPEDKPGVLARLNKIIDEAVETDWEDEYRFKKANGEYAWVRERGRVIYDSGKKASRLIGATQDITKNVILENKLVHERHLVQRKITEAVLTAQEYERASIGRELHDNLGQILAVTKLYVQMAKRFELKSELYLDKSCELIVQVMEEIRKISKALVIPDLNIIGLFDNIRNLVHDLSIIHPIKIDFQSEHINENDLERNLQVTIFRIIQEQMNNVLKHAKASWVSIKLSVVENAVVLNIRDNGIGCDISKEKNGVGIINIGSRADLYNGSATIMSSPGEGYALNVVLPLNDPL